ncbi:AmmeMemoRadiSam system protein B [Sedimenticola thiotaurini]|uniref:MEMO1 family protein AAY24_03370 n=1 Tax=Sedimenticola thiotaurini TaxID=1543721 RepID=A0A0F7JVH1_9GAMM|nr:AmmeMemoRadiSam system protein B [Sedimenticola thiotaurini]AKH19552.1 dioxygenase [Sedimenticola thiotaurini]
MSRTIKHSAVAGAFYPAEPETLHRQVQQFIDAARPVSDTRPRALIAPHAGYIYSGPIAGSAYATLLNSSDIHRVILLAPAHRVAFRGIAYSSATHFETPLGLIPVDQELLGKIACSPSLQLNDDAFRDEHSIEVQLPFLQEILTDFKIVPLLVGDASPPQVAEILEQTWDVPENLIVISSDLSHYLDYESATEMDQKTSQAIEALQPEALTYHSACGRTPVSGLLLVAKKHGLKARTLDLRNSGDTAGPRDRVVGYGAYVFS